jgi:glycerophosphoryl diester phosphodiesterase
MTRRDLMLCAAAASLSGCATMRSEPQRRRPLVIAHRGASGARPEHTLAAYQLAIEQGADFIEPDLVMTRDGVLVVRHENEIGETTDVARRREFADRRTIKSVDGKFVTGWFTEDFTVAELKTLRARERLPQLRPANTAYDGQEPILTFEDVLGLAARASRELGRAVGIYPELKHPTHFAGLGLDPVPPLLTGLANRGLDTPEAAVFIQCFEVGTLRRLRARTGARLVQLMSHAGGPFDLPGRTYVEMATPAGLAEIRTYADAIGPEKTLVIPRDSDGHSTGPTRLVGDAHAAGLQVHPWTFRSENQFLPLELRRGTDPAAEGDYAGEYMAYFAAGVDAVFSDHPADAVRTAAAFAR